MPRFDTVVEAAKYMAPTDTLSFVIIALFFIFLVTVFVGGNYFSAFMEKRQRREHFFRIAETHGLTKDEATFLWKIAHEKGSDPMLMLEYKAPFEKAVDFYIDRHKEASEKMIMAIRKKLGYVNLPAFVPLYLSKDIDLYQGGKMRLDGTRIVDVMLHDKDERFMYWLLHDIKNLNGLKNNHEVQVTFLRDGDAIYTFNAPVEEVLEERGRKILKLPHTYELHRNQRRELSRVQCDLPAWLSVEEWTEESVPQNWFEGKLLDISASGVKFQLSPVHESAVELFNNDEVVLRFDFEGTEVMAKGKIMSIKRVDKETFYGIKFTEIDDRAKDKIYNFVLDEQKKLAQFIRLQKDI
jgi:c-di-GMP-binding flagellar brake protein YcgR